MPSLYLLSKWSQKLLIKWSFSGQRNLGRNTVFTQYGITLSNEGHDLNTDIYFVFFSSLKTFSFKNDPFSADGKAASVVLIPVECKLQLIITSQPYFLQLLFVTGPRTVSKGWSLIEWPPLTTYLIFIVFILIPENSETCTLSGG